MALLSNVSIEGILEYAGLRKIPKYGVAFGGGGAKGFAHIGVITAFDRFGIKPEILSGVSAGSIAAVLYGAGLSPHDMIDCFAESQKFADFTEFSVPTSGFFRLDKFGKMLESWLPVRNLEELKIPTVVCATNFDKGTSVGWCKGEIVPRVLASCSIPIIFRPVLINDIHGSLDLFPGICRLRAIRRGRTVKPFQQPRSGDCRRKRNYRGNRIDLVCRR